MDWKALVKTVAPVLGTALGGPMAGAATKFIAGKLLGDENASEDQVAQAIMTASPEKLLEIKKLDYEFKTKMAQIGVDVFRLEVEDRKSARDLARVNMKPHIVLSILYTIGYFVLLYLFMTGNVQVATTLKTEFNIVLGVMTLAQGQIMQFWFGSSSGSKEKDSARPTA